MPGKYSISMKAESSKQVVQIQGGARLLSMLDDLGSMESVIRKSTLYVKSWNPESKNKAELAKARNAKDYMKIIADTWKSCQAIEMKSEKLKGSGDSEDIFDSSSLSNEQIKEIAKILEKGGNEVEKDAELVGVSGGN